jgi:hypothetical protein
MNIDERLEALTHTVELIAGMQLATDKELQQLTGKMDQLTVRMTVMTDTVNRLGIGFEDRENRIRGFEEE